MTKIELLKGDITKVAVEAIVNAANESLLGGGGVDGAIHRAAGPRLLAECASLGGCKTGQAKITKGYDLPAKYVIHTVGPVWRGGINKEDKLLASCYLGSLELVKSKNIKTIAFPSISTGVYGFPIARASGIVFQTVKGFLEKNKNCLEKIVFVLFSDKDLAVYQSIYGKSPINNKIQ